MQCPSRRKRGPSNARTALCFVPFSCQRTAPRPVMAAHGWLKGDGQRYRSRQRKKQPVVKRPALSTRGSVRQSSALFDCL